MPTPIGHAAAAAAIGAVVLPKAAGLRAWPLGIACAILPDLDVIGFAFGIRYSDMLGHRGLSHSLLFSVALGLGVTALAFRQAKWDSTKLRIALFLCLAAASHGVLDAFTNGGLGIAFFAPLTAERYFFPVRPIEVSPIGSAFFSERGLDVLKSESIWVLVPAAMMAMLALTIRRWGSRRTGAEAARSATTSGSSASETASK